MFGGDISEYERKPARYRPGYAIKKRYRTGDWKVAGTRSLERPRYCSADIRVGGSRGHACPRTLSDRALRTYNHSPNPVVAEP